LSTECHHPDFILPSRKAVGGRGKIEDCDGTSESFRSFATPADCRIEKNSSVHSI
jgi:hypothetical protein